MQVFADEKVDTKLFGGCFQARGHVDVGTEVAGVNFVLWADGSLDGPANMQAESHTDLAILAEGWFQAGILAILEYQRVFVYLD